MRYRLPAYAFSALLMGSVHVAPALADGTAQTPNDLSGYWQRDDGKIVHFTQDGSSLTSRFSKRSARDGDPEIDFTATVHGNLIYGTHRGPFDRVMQKKCSIQIWVGMGLTLSDDQTELKGFRGDRIVDAKNCSAKNRDPVELVYSRMPADTPLQ